MTACCPADDLYDSGIEEVEHIRPTEPDDFERRNKVRYCRRCGYLLWSEKLGDRTDKPCRRIPIDLR